MFMARTRDGSEILTVHRLQDEPAIVIGIHTVEPGSLHIKEPVGHFTLDFVEAIDLYRALELAIEGDEQ